MPPDPQPHPRAGDERLGRYDATEEGSLRITLGLQEGQVRGVVLEAGPDTAPRVAFDRAIRLATAHGRPAPLSRWMAERDAIYNQIMDKGWSVEREAFVQQYGDKALDASLLKMPQVGFVAPGDPMGQSTLRAMNAEPVSDSLVYRYDPNASPDGLLGSEGTFSLRTFLYVYSEEIAATGEQIGNFPQAFTHLGLINAAITLNDCLDDAADKPGRSGRRACNVPRQLPSRVTSEGR